MLIFQNIFDQYINQTQRVWEHDRTKTIGASEIGVCLRKAFFTKNSYPQDADYTQSWGATHRGQAIENNYVVPALLSGMPEGSELLFAGDDQRTLIDGYLSATPDGLITNLPPDALKQYGIDDIESDCIAVEIKSHDPQKSTQEADPKYVWQVQQQMHLIHKTTNHRPEYAVILYVNASWWDRITVFVIKRDPKMGELCEKRANMIYAAKDAKELPPEGKLGGGRDCQYCPFQSLCSVTQIGSVPTTKRDSKFTEDEEQTVEELIQQQKTLSKQIDDLEAKKQQATEAVKEFLRKHDTKWAKTGSGFSASWSVSAGRKKVDIDRIVEDTGIDVEQYTTFGDPIERLTLKAPKE